MFQRIGFYLVVAHYSHILDAKSHAGTCTSKRALLFQGCERDTPMEDQFITGEEMEQVQSEIMG